MIKPVLLLACIVLALYSRAAEGDEISAGKYVVVSQVFSMDVPAGKCLVTGKVMGPQPGTNERVPVEEGVIVTLDGSKRTYTDNSGTYSLLLDDSDSALYFVGDGLTEIAIKSFDFRSQYKVTINFFPEIQYIINVVDKPVIYFYSDNEHSADITFSCRGDLVFTYPTYDGNWELAVQGNTITDRNTGKTYPYLFWESQTQNMQFEKSSGNLEGFVIQTDTAVNFLESSLTALGLSPTEQTDFITYWIPKLMQSEYVFIQFWIDDAYAENISQMTITPAPDAIRRVFMAYAQLETTVVPAAVKPQHLAGFERKSFTVVEWGGSQLQAPAFIP
jgi:hypothetical protein